MKALMGLVSGRVQGVWYRRSVQQAMIPLGITGYAKNLPDGRVEVLLCGAEEILNHGKQAVLDGSPRSVVTDIEWQEVELRDPPGEFSCR